MKRGRRVGGPGPRQVAEVFPVTPPTTPVGPQASARRRLALAGDGVARHRRRADLAPDEADRDRPYGLLLLP